MLWLYRALPVEIGLQIIDLGAGKTVSEVDAISQNVIASQDKAALKMVLFVIFLKFPHAF